MKSKEQIREETPLSVTSTDNAIYEFSFFDKSVFKIYDMWEDEHGHRFNYYTLSDAELKYGDRLRLIQCFDDETPNYYRWGEHNQFLIISDSNMIYISGDVDFRKTEK